MSNEKIFSYPGKSLNVEWDERLCIHVGECGKAEGDLFVDGRDPWCQPDLSPDEEVMDVVKRCPSGALTLKRDGQLVEEVPEKDNVVQVIYNGPLAVRGDLNIEDVPEDMPGIRVRAMLCRCGKSRNKPFCDNQHLKAGFTDSGAVGRAGGKVTGDSGNLKIRAAKDGPLLLSGDFVLITGSGRVAWKGDKAGLCRCGESKNKPFCDGSHKAAGFKSD